MKKKIQTIEVIARDYYGDECLADRCMGNEVVDRKTPHGFVEIYEVDDNGKKKLVGKSNLVLYHGREMLAQRLVNLPNSDVTPTKDEFITWFGLGDGGVIPGDPLNPSAPTLVDSDLSSRVMITATDSSAADYHVVGVPDASYKETGYYKIPFDSVEFEQDELNDDKWLVLKIQTTVVSAYANGKQLSEAGLFSAEDSAGGYTGQFSLFARVTFPSIVKTSDRRLIFSWYLYL